MSDASSVPALRELFLRFTQVSLSGFGGVMPFARRMLVEERRWLSPEGFTDVLSLCQLLPGPNIVNVAVCVGARYHGVRGAVAAFAGLMAAPFFVVLALGALYTEYGHLPAVSALFRGISAAAAGLVVAMGIKMATSRRLRWAQPFRQSAPSSVAHPKSRSPFANPKRLCPRGHRCSEGIV